MLPSGKIRRVEFAPAGKPIDKRRGSVARTRWSGNTNLPDDESSSPTSSLDCTVTQTGQWVGTPAYLAPEVRAGAPATAASDQYAFAVALHEALYGARPDQAPASAAGVPKRLRAVVERALASNPGDRYPSMRELLAELGHDPRRTRMRWIAGASAAALVAAIGVVATGRIATPRPCGDSESLVAPLWDQASRARALEAFRKTGRPTADDTFARVDTALRRRLDGWVRAHRETCEATEVRHEQSGELLDRRMDCLGQARMKIGAFVELLGGVDARALDRAAVAANEVGDVADCGQAASLVPAVPLPRDPEARREVDRLRVELARLHGLRILGQYKDGLAAANDLVRRSRATAYEPVLAESLLLRSWFESNTDDKPAALKDLYDVVGLASDAKDDIDLARATNLIATVAAHGQGGFAAANVAYPIALGATARAGNRPELLWQLFHNRAGVLYKKGDLIGALAFYQLQYLLAPVAYGQDSWQMAVALQDLADAMSGLGGAGAAGDLYRRALAVAERVLGPDHDRIGTLLNNYALNLLNVRDADRAAVTLERALAIEELNHPSDSRQVAYPLANLALARLAQRRIPEARALIDRGLRIDQIRVGSDDASAALDLLISGDVARAEGRLGAAHELKQRGISLQQKAVGAGSAIEGNALRDDAAILLRLRRVKEAHETAARAVAVEAKAMGEHFPDLGLQLWVLADVLAEEGQWKDARARYQDAVGLLEVYGADSPWLVEPLVGLAAALVATGDAARAVTCAERAVALAGAHHLSDDLVGAAQFGLARARWALGADRPAAVELARVVDARLGALPFRAEIQPEIDRWLAGVARP